MTGERINGAAIAAEIREDVKARAAALRARGVIPGLAAILAGDDPDSRIVVDSASSFGMAKELKVEAKVWW